MKKMLLKLHPPVGCGAEELRLPANAMAETTSNHRAGHSMEGIKNDESRQEPKPKKETPPNLPNELTSSVEPIAEATGKSTPRGVLTVPAANQLEDYPGAEAFPLMSNAELNNLADDIRQKRLC